VTVQDVLEKYGHDVGTGSRTVCPLHAGTNRQAFSYTDQEWYCFACGEGGTALGLADRLAGTTWHPVEGFPDPPILGPSGGSRRGGSYPPSHPVPLGPGTALLRGLAHQKRALLEASVSAHGRGERILGVVEGLLEQYRGVPDTAERLAVFEAAAVWWAEGRRWLALAHASGGRECGCVEG